jgi:hypothetical protein
MATKRILIIYLVALVSFSGFSQDSLQTKKKEKSGIYLDASTGVSIPLGNYANDDPKDDATGYANPGFFVQAGIDWMGKNDFGLAFQLGYQNNSLKDTAKTVIPDRSDKPMGDGSWSNIYLMAGVAYLKQMNKLSVDAKFLGGFIISSSPVFRTYNPESKMNEGSTGTGLALGLSVGVGYNVSSKVALKATLGYNAGFPKIDKQYNATVIGIDSLTGQYIYSAPSQYNIKKTVSSINAGAGVVYKF